MANANNPLIAELLGATITWPNAQINEMGPLPSAPNSLQADGIINSEKSRFLESGLQDLIYSYGPNPDRITTQTQNNIPNKVQRIIPKLFLPSAQSDGSAVQDPILEHAITDGDLVFSIMMNREMAEDSQRYVIYPRGYSHNALKLINLATVNYMLWGLQVGSLMPGNLMWLNYFRQLCQTDHEVLLARLQEHTGADDVADYRRPERLSTQEMIWNFIQTYIAPIGVQHGSDRQGGQHEGSKTRVVQNAVDYVAAFAVEGKLLHVNNLWKACDVYEDDDVVLALRYMPAQPSPILFNLSSSNRAHRSERAHVPFGWWYLRPEVLRFKSIIDTPHIHVGRSQKMITAYVNPNLGSDMTFCNARSAIQGTRLQMTFEPGYVNSDMICFKDELCVRPRAPVPPPVMGLPEALPPPLAAVDEVAITSQQQHAYVPRPPHNSNKRDPPPPAAAEFAAAMQPPAS